MGNSMGKKRKMASGPLTKHRQGSHVVSLTSSSLNNMVVVFPKEIEEDLERRKIESFNELAAGSNQSSWTRKTLASDPAHDMYEKLRRLDVPAVILPKPWSEVDQILSKFKPSVNEDACSSPFCRKPTAENLEALPETIDMWELMDDLNEKEDDDAEMSRNEAVNCTHSTERVKWESITPKIVRSLHSSISFSTIDTVKEVETVTSILEVKNDRESTSKRPVVAQMTSLPAAIAAATPRKVNVDPRLLARMEAFS